MPDEILELVCSFLELSSQKNFASSCKKFNEIFGMPRNLDRLCFSVKKGQPADITITRKYRHVSEVGDVISSQAWENLSEGMKSYRYQDCEIETTKKLLFKWESIEYPYITSAKLLQMLPHFSKLNTLILSSIGIKSEECAKLQILTTRPVIEMKHLQILRIEFQVLMIMINRFMKFPDNKLMTLELTFDFNLVATLENEKEEISAVKDLIVSQKNLSELILKHDSSSLMAQMLDNPMNLSSQLRRFEVLIMPDSWLSFFNSTRQDHLYDFLLNPLNQKSLEKIKLRIDLDERKTSKMQHFWDSRLNMKITDRCIRCRSSGRDYNVIIDFDDYTLDDMTRMQEPDLTTTQLTLIFWFQSITSFKFNLLSKMFPNLATLTINLEQMVNPEQETILSELKQLQSLTLLIWDFKMLPLINVPNLKELRVSRTGSRNPPNDIECVKSILKQHKQIEKFFLISRTKVSQELFLTPEMDEKNHEILECALKQRSNTLREVEMSADFFYSNDAWTRPDGNWSVRSQRYIRTMQVHARRGFIFKCESKKLMKRFDDQVVDIEK